MSDHQCNKEADIAVLKQICESDIPYMKSMLDKIFKRLEGDNGDGIITRLRIVETNIQNVPTLKKIIRLSMIWGGASGALIICAYLGIKTLA